MGTNWYKMYRVRWKFYIFPQHALHRMSKHMWFASHHGKFEKILVETQPCQDNINVKVSCIYENYKKYEHFLHKAGAQCNTTLKLQKGLSCLTFTFDNHRRCLVFLRQNDTLANSSGQIIFNSGKSLCEHTEKGNVPRNNPFHDFIALISQVTRPTMNQLTSWAESSQMCRYAGGYLPSFTGREQLNEFVAFVKLSDIPHMEAVFIGLVAFNRNTQQHKEGGKVIMFSLLLWSQCW